MNAPALQTITVTDPVADLEDRAELDAAVDRLDGVAELVAPPGERRDALQGQWLGHPLHPPLTDLVVGFWTSAMVLDLVPARRLRPAADLFVALGLASAVPTVAAGLADWAELDRPRRRVGAVHAGANSVAAGCYALSLLHRLRGRRARAVGLALLGATAATVGGHLGGHLAFPPDGAPDAEPEPVPTAPANPA